MIFNIWLVMALFYLGVMTFQDYKNMFIDDRNNYFMSGLSLALINDYPQSILYILALLAAIFIMSFLMARIKGIGAGDISALRWLILSFGIIGFKSLIVFLAALIIGTIAFFIGGGLSQILQGEKETLKQPFFIVLTLSFLMSCSLLFV